MEVLFTFTIKDYQQEGLLKRFPQVTFHFDKKPNDAAVEKADVIVTYGEDVDDSLLDRAKTLQWLMVASAGVDKMPLAKIAEYGIVISNVRGIHKVPMAESVLAHILAIRRALPLIYERQKAKEWNRKVHSREVRGSTALILGPGAIGGEIGRLLQAFGVKTIGCNRSGRKSESMDETIVYGNLIDRLPEADFVIAVLPSTPNTRGLLQAEHFNAMKESAVFMNFGRGDLFNESVLIEALKSGAIGHAVLDVFETEPLPAESEFWSLENCVISPHASSFSGKYIERSLEIFEENLEKWLQDDRDLINLIEAERGY